MTTARLAFHRFAAALVCVSLLVPPGQAKEKELKQKTLETFNRYVTLTETRMNAEVAKADAFLWVDTLAEPRRAKVFAKLKRGDVLIEKLTTLDNGKKIQDDDGLIHHWVGVVFIPGAKLQDVLGLMQDYDRYAEYFQQGAFPRMEYYEPLAESCKPAIAHSKILFHEGDDFRTVMRFRQKTTMEERDASTWPFDFRIRQTIVLDSENEIRYVLLDATRVHMRSIATRIVPIQNVGKSNEQQLPPSGFMWRLNTYWRFQERDGGVYLQCESVALTDDLPFVARGIVRPFMTCFTRGLPVLMLGATRRILLERR